jgi:hypothetical protein
MKPLERAADREDYERAAVAAARAAAEAHARMHAAGRMPHWVQMDHRTTDQPGAHLARLWVLRPEPAPTNVLLRAGTAAEIQALLPPGLAFLPRDPADEPCIVGTWL